MKIGMTVLCGLRRLLFVLPGVLLMKFLCELMMIVVRAAWLNATIFLGRELALEMKRSQEVERWAEGVTTILQNSSQMGPNYQEH